MNTFNEEKIQLELNLNKMSKTLHELTKQLNRYDLQHQDLKTYLADSYNEIDAMEIFSNQQSLTRIDQTALMAHKQKVKLEKIIQSPYFSRIDFIYDGETEEDTEKIYIGRFSYTDEEGHIVVHDWRAPISNMYYEFELGPASYQAHEQTIKGEITKRRQIKIEDSKLDFVVESNMTINDSVLQQELSKNADHKMKTIISTIQKEQNAIIRNELAHTLIIQGVAGSGKTSIALHRIAYLLYKFKETLTPDRVMIISPNKVFSAYIATVLPELGEDPIVETSIEDLASQLVKGKLSFNTHYSQVKSMIEDPNGELAKRAAFKSSMSYYKQLMDYLALMDQQLLQVGDMTINGITFEEKDLVERFIKYNKHPVAKRIEYMADDLEAIIPAKPTATKKRNLKSDILKRLKQNVILATPYALYTKFYKHINKQDMLYVKHDQLEFSDLFPYIMCVDYMLGIEAFDHIRHLVVDEMQDYTPVQFAVIQKLFPCQKTIVGDISQSMNPYAASSPDKFRDLFGKHQYVELRKSYRSSYNIIQFAKQFLPNDTIEAVERYGQEPYIKAYHGIVDMTQLVTKQLEAFNQSDYKTCALLCKNDAQLNELYTILKEQFEINKLDETSFSFQSGITLSSIALAKGLEFDAVVIPYVDQATYYDRFDNNMLYISCTRALHELTILVDKDQPSPLLSVNISY